MRRHVGDFQELLEDLRLFKDSIIMRLTTLDDRWPKLLAFSASFLSAVCFGAQHPTFTVQVLGNLPGGAVIGVWGINNAGEAVGQAGGGSSVCTNGCAVVWRDGTPTALGSVAISGEYDTVGLSINNAGQVVGNVFTTPHSQFTAVVWNNEVPTLLPSPAPQLVQTNALFINDAGQVVGEAYEYDNAGQEAVEWNGVTPVVLGTVPGCTEGSYATGINKDGIVVGLNYCTAKSDYEATIWNGTSAALLGGGIAKAVNNAGLVVGEGPDGAAAWSNGVITNLGILAGGEISSATAVNNRGNIVGQSATSGGSQYRAVLWTSTGAPIQDLNRLISTEVAKDYVLTEAEGINDSCAIVVNGYARNDDVVNLAFVLKPIDPSSCANGLLVQKPKN
jgi:probable HAF family extracellular repeat protein